VPTALEPVHGDDIGTHSLSSQRVADADALVDDDATSVLKLFDPLPGIATGGFNDFNTFGNYHVGIRLVVRRLERGKQCEVDSKGLVGEALALANLFAKLVMRRLRECSDTSQTARVGYSRGERRVPNLEEPMSNWSSLGKMTKIPNALTYVVQAAHNNRVHNSEHFRHFSRDHHLRAPSHRTTR
jgi:hypothetical protein